MSPKKSAAGSGKKSARKAAPKKPAPKAPSPMRKTDIAVGKNVNGLRDQARAAHELPREAPQRAAGARSQPAAPMNTPPAPPTAPAIDKGQEI